MLIGWDLTILFLSRPMRMNAERIENKKSHSEFLWWENGETFIILVTKTCQWLWKWLKIETLDPSEQCYPIKAIEWMGFFIDVFSAGLSVNFFDSSLLCQWSNSLVAQTADKWKSAINAKTTTKTARIAHKKKFWTSWICSLILL